MRTPMHSLRINTRVRNKLLQLLPVFLLLALQGNAQLSVTSYAVDENLKGYATDVFPGTDEYVFAGTHYVNTSTSWRRDVHFVYRDFSSGAFTSVLYSLGDKVDFTAVDIAVDADTSYITCLVRRPDTPARIKVLKVDKTGAILREVNLYSQNLTFKHVFPLNSLFYDHHLYICGYKANVVEVVGLEEPNYDVNKRAFVIRLNVNALTEDALNYNTSVSPTTSINDYDIAMRMDVARYLGPPVGNFSGNTAIYVTGSANVAYGTGSGIEYPSGTMNMMIDPFDLSVLQTKPFVWNGATEDDNGQGEFGMGLADAYNPGGGLTDYYFVLGNDFHPRNVAAASSLFMPKAHKYWMTLIDAGLNVVTVPNTGNRFRILHDSAWALQFHQRDDEYCVAGMTSRCDDGVTSYYDNIIPFTSRFAANYDGTNLTVTSSPIHHLYRSTNGTGALGTYPNYAEIGSGISNIAWNPVFAANNSDYAVLAAPYLRDDRYLNFKFIRTDLAGEVRDCRESWDKHAVDIEPIVAVPNCYNAPTVTPSYTTGVYSPPLDDHRQVHVDPLALVSYDCYTKYWKQTPAQAPAEAYDVNIYPNPASSMIEVAVAGIPSDNDVQLRLIDVSGKVLKGLFIGTAEELKGKKISLPKGLSGMYTIEVSCESQPTMLKKIVINN